VTQLTADLSRPLLEILLREPGFVDGVEVGSWHPQSSIRWYRQKLPDLPFYFHGAEMVQTVGIRPGAIARMRAHLNASESRWLSLHMSAWLPRWLRALLRRGWRLPKPNPGLDARRLVWQVRRVARAVPARVLLENNDPLPWPGYDYHCDPGWIRRVLEQTDCALLLDTGHARIAAAHLGMETTAYLDQLPLERALQVHISGPREKNGRLYDAHQSLQEEDYGLLEFILGGCQPQVVTLEYVRNEEGLREQVGRLRAMLKQTPGG